VNRPVEGPFEDGRRWSRCACSRPVRSWARPRRPFTARSAPTRGKAPHTWGVPKEFADVIVTAMVALDTVSGDGAAVVEHKLQGRAPDEITGGWGHPAPPGPSDQRGHGGSRHNGVRGTGPHGEAVEVTHTWEDMEARLGWPILTGAALDDLTGCCLGHGG
jgi:hypothetical protein